MVNNKLYDNYLARLEENEHSKYGRNIPEKVVVLDEMFGNMSAKHHVKGMCRSDAEDMMINAVQDIINYKDYSKVSQNLELMQDAENTASYIINNMSKEERNEYFS